MTAWTKHNQENLVAVRSGKWDLTKATTVGDQRVLEMNRETNNFVTETSFANGRQINF